LETEREDAAVLIPSRGNLACARGCVPGGLAGRPAAAQLKLNPKSGPALIDLTGLSKIKRMPPARSLGRGSCAGPSAQGDIQVIAHPAAIAITALLAALSREGTLRRSLIMYLIRPASGASRRRWSSAAERGVLSFKKLKTDVFDAQLP